MATPANDSYSVASGLGIYGGKYNYVLAIAASNMAPGDFVEIDASSLNTQTSGLYPNDGRTNDEMTDWAVSGVYDADRRRVYIAGAPANTLLDPSASAILRYDIATNTWDAIRNPWGVVLGHCYDGSGYHNGILYKSRFYGDVLRYDMVNNVALSSIANPPTDIGDGSAAWSNEDGLTIHPNMGAAGSIIWCNYSLGRNCRYDIATDTWSVLNQTGNIVSAACVAHYSPTSDKVIYGLGTTSHPLYMCDASGVVVATDNCPMNIYAQATGVLFCAIPNQQKSILIADDNTIYTLDHSSGAWTNEGTAAVNYPAAKNDKRWIAPIDDFNVLLISEYGANGTSKVWLHRYA